MVSGGPLILARLLCSGVPARSELFGFATRGRGVAVPAATGHLARRKGGFGRWARQVAQAASDGDFQVGGGKGGYFNGAEDTTGGMSAPTEEERRAEAVRLADEKMDGAIGRLGFKWYQALLTLYVLLLYAADGAEVTVVSLLSGTIAEKWGLESWQKGVLGMSVYSGMFASAFFAGPMADIIGRAKTLMLSTFFLSSFGLLSALAPSIGLLCVCRFIVGLGMGSSLPTASSLLLETVPARIRGALICLVFLGFSLGDYFLAFMGERYAKAGVADPSGLLFVVAAVPAVLTLVGSFFLPESPRYLAARGKERALSRWFKRASKLNGVPVAELLPGGDRDVKALCENGRPRRRRKIGPIKPPSLGAVLTSPKEVVRRTRKAAVAVGGKFREVLAVHPFRTVLLWALWMACNGVFYGIIFCTPELVAKAQVASGALGFDVAGGISLVAAVPVLAILPAVACVAMGVGYQRLFIACFGAALACLGMVLHGGMAMNPTHFVYLLALAKFFYNAAFVLLYPATGEFYPTNVRATGTALAGAAGRICAILVAPLCTVLMDSSAILTFRYFFGVTAVAWVSSFFLRIPSQEHKEAEA